MRMEGLPLEDGDPDEHPARATPTEIAATSATASRRFIGASFRAVERNERKASSLQVEVMLHDFTRSYIVFPKSLRRASSNLTQARLAAYESSMERARGTDIRT